METSKVNWSLRVTLDAPDIHLEQEREGLQLGQNWSRTHIPAVLNRIKV